MSRGIFCGFLTKMALTGSFKISTSSDRDGDITVCDNLAFVEVKYWVICKLL